MISLGISFWACYFVGTLFPIWQSYKALATPSNVDDAQEALTAACTADWVVFSVITAAEALITTFFSYVPLYYEGKLLLLVWMMAPQTKGAQYLFDHYISPFLKLHAAKLDPVFASTNIVISSAQMGQVLRLAEKYGASATDQAIAQAALALQQGNAPGQKGRTPPASYPAPQQQPQRGQPQQYAQPQSNYPQSQYPARAQEHSEFPSVPRW